MSAAIDNSKEPEFTVIARIAAIVVGRIVSPLSPSLHLTLLIKDLYDGVTAIDGQPDGGFRIGGFERIKSNFYKNTIPNHLLTYNNQMTVAERLKYSNPKDIEISIIPPKFITPRDFKDKLIRNAKNFSGVITPYSVPRNIGGDRMISGQYNSSSYLIGLLNSVAGDGIGYDIVIRTALRGYQVPGLDMPIPSGHFTG
jgi:hypothetical protein